MFPGILFLLSANFFDLLTTYFCVKKYGPGIESNKLLRKWLKSNNLIGTLAIFFVFGGIGYFIIVYVANIISPVLCYLICYGWGVVKIYVGFKNIIFLFR